MPEGLVSHEHLPFYAVNVTHCLKDLDVGVINEPLHGKQTIFRDRYFRPLSACMAENEASR